MQASGKQQPNTKDRILDAAEDVFCRKGYSKTTLNDIAQAAGMTRGAIYWNFKNKEDLFGEMCKRARDPFCERMKEVLSVEMENPIEFLRETHDWYIRLITEDIHLRKVASFLVLRCEKVGETAQIYSQLREGREILREILRRSLIEAQKRRLMSENLDTEMAVDILFYSYWGMLRKWFRAPEDIDIVDYGGKQQEALLEMFQTSPHMRLVQK